MPQKKTSFTYKLTPEQQQALRGILETGNYRPHTVPYTQVAVKSEDYSVALYESGKCLVQGKGAADFVLFTLEPMVLQTVGHGYEDVLNPEATEAHLGVDESGKGDFFGPMVIAGVYVDKELVEAMRELNVRDSKTITSDRVAFSIASEIRKLLGTRFEVVTIGPAAYNRLYMKMRNVNTMLAWGHARVIENLLEKVPGCPRAISDQFGSKDLIKKALMSRGQKIDLVQRHKAESDMAVAAASILARAAFLNALQRMGERHGLEIPRGASAAVRDVAGKLVESKGPEVLVETVKCHFKTTDQVLEGAGHRRAELPPEGRAVSRTSNFQRRGSSQGA